MHERVRLVKTNDSCPEAYDAYIGAEYVGFIRLRNGGFSAMYEPTKNLALSRMVYTATPEGDGCFNDDDEREKHLSMASLAFLAAFKTDNPGHKSLPYYLSGKPQPKDYYDPM